MNDVTDMRIVPHGLCGKTLDPESKDYCGALSLYVFHLKNWPPHWVGGACREHVAFVRQNPDLDWIKSY